MLKLWLDENLPRVVERMVQAEVELIDPFHWVGRAEGQRASEHLVKANAERIEIAPRIDRAVHPSVNTLLLRGARQ